MEKGLGLKGKVKYTQELPGVAIANSRGLTKGSYMKKYDALSEKFFTDLIASQINDDTKVTLRLKRKRTPAIGIDLTKDNYKTYTIKEPNELQFKWLSANGEGLTLVFIYTYKSPKSVVKAVNRFRRNLRKVYGRKQANSLNNRLVIYYISALNEPQLLFKYRECVMQALDEPVTLWNPEAGFSKGGIDHEPAQPN